MRNWQRLGIVLLVAVSFLAIGAGTITGAVDVLWNPTPQDEVAFSLAPPTPTPVESLALVILGLDELEWTDFYDAASALERDAQAIMNAVYLIRRGSIQNVDFTTDQLNALKDQGLGGMVRAVGHYADMQEISGVDQAALNLWEASNPQKQQCYLSYQAPGCPSIE
ncbi:hypothetical protein LCGC14_2713450 [marine sediment metagenome]|uniref:Uncharacterized protein n=1 Tax=marine sediment metagenome TaxID=412755 RepID=A0A0F9BLD3_9ZZZZ